MSPREPKDFFKKDPGSPAKVAIFLSGSGTNAEKILDLWKSGCDAFLPVCLVTDRPLDSRAGELSEKYGLDLVSLDIKEFYQSKGLSSTSLATEEGRQAREDWTAELFEKIKHLEIDFGIFAGFIPLTNITDHFPCLNVHPGDLTELDDKGERVLTGLHTLPIQKAFLKGDEALRSCVIVACAYEEEGDGMDEGLIVGISEEVAIELKGKSREEWISEFESRGDRPAGGWKDSFQEFLKENLECLKENGDWVVFPKVVEDFAKGKFAYSGSQLYFSSNGNWLPIEVIEYGKAGKEVYFKGLGTE